MNKLSKQDAWALLARYTETPALQKHALQVAAAMEHFARLAGPGEDPEVWWAAGLLHDLDYEKYPEEHCKKSEELMRAAGLDEVYIRAMLCHGYGLVTDTKPESRLEKTLYTVDELTGLINAACLVRPSTLSTRPAWSAPPKACWTSRSSRSRRSSRTRRSPPGSTAR